jgi:phage terminase large subunit GpA-like protein
MIPVSEAVSTADAAQVYRPAYAKGLKPDPLLKVSDWADKHRILTTRSSPEPGPWRTSRTPYLREPMDCLSPSNRAEIVVLMSGAQIGKTECGNNWIGYNIHQAPGPMLAVQPTVDMAKRNSKQRIGPLIEDCPPLKQLVREPRARDSGNTVLAKEFPGGILVLTGANSAKGLRSMPTRYLFLDEVDGYPGDVDGEGEPCSLAIARTTNYSRRKIFITSTPAASRLSRIERFFLMGDQRRYFVPCPFCQHMQTLRFEQLVWPKRNPKAVHYVCEECKAPIPNHAKNWMLPRGEWRPTEATDGRIRTFHINSLYSPVGWMTWAQIADLFEQAEGDPEKLQVFWNTVLGLPWTDEGEVPDVDRLFDRRELYPIGIVPMGGLVLTAGADVQARRIEVEIVAWGRGKQTWSVDYRILEGDTQQPAVWAALTALLDEEFPTVYGNPVRITKLGVDTGFNTTAVYEFMRNSTPRHRVMGIKGNSTSSALVNLPSLIEVTPQGRRLPPGIRLWPVNVSIGKEQLYRWLKSSIPDLDAGEKWPAGFCHFPQYGKGYFEQLCAEQLVMRTRPNGLKQPVWEKRRDRNEALDCRLYAMAAAAALRLDTWNPDRWDSIEQSLSAVTAAPAPPRTPNIRPACSPMPKFQSFGPKESGE